MDLSNPHQDTPEQTTERKRIYWKRAKWCNFTGFLLGTLVIAPIIIAVGDRRDPIDFIDGRMVPKNVYPGQVVEVHWYAERKRAGCDGEFSRRIIDAAGKIHDFLIEPETAPKKLLVIGKPEKIPRTFLLPDGMVPGRAYYTPRGHFWCNWLQKMLWPMELDAPWVPFNVLALPGAIPKDNSMPGPVQEPEDGKDEHPRTPSAPSRNLRR